LTSIPYYTQGQDNVNWR